MQDPIFAGEIKVLFNVSLLIFTFYIVSDFCLSYKVLHILLKANFLRL